MANRLDEAFLALVMLASVLTFTAVFVGPWGGLKTAAFEIGTRNWWLFAAGFLILNLLVLPGLFVSAVWLSRWIAHGRLPLAREISNQSQALLPLGLLAWMAFTVSFALPKLGYILGVLNDPFGWGWNLLGPGYTFWQPDVAVFSPLLQVALLLVGLLWASRVAHQLAEPNTRRSAPLMAFGLAFTFSMLWLLVG
jgi:hypothetical protein